MMAAVRKPRSHRKVAAFNFLTNISLDGTHADTKYGLLKRKGFKRITKNNGGSCSDRGEEENVRNGSADADGDHENRDPCSPASPVKVPLSSNQRTESQNSPNNRKNHKNLALLSSAKAQENKCVTILTEDIKSSSQTSVTQSAITTSTSEENSGVVKAQTIAEQSTVCPPSSTSSKRHRANSYSGEKKPSVRRRRLFPSLSISEDTSPPESTEYLSDQLLTSSASQRLRHQSTSSSVSSLGSITRPAVHVLNKDSSLLRANRPRWARRDSRIVLTSEKKAPFLLYSALPYSKHSKLIARVDTKKQVVTSQENLLGLGLIGTDRVEDGQDISYSQFLVPSLYSTRSNKFGSSGRNAAQSNSTESQLLVPIAESAHVSPAARSPSSEAVIPLFRSFSHDPALLQHYHNQQSSLLPTVLESEVEGSVLPAGVIGSQLDDPELRSGKHRTLLTFPSYMTSVIDYVKPSDLKKELNEKFREKFPNIQLTLSKLRSLKQVIKKIGHIKCGVDLWTIAQAYVYFERIILKGLINKPNRRLCAGACLMLSAKLNDVKGPHLTKLIDEIEDTFKLHRRELLLCEFRILVALEFGLLVSDAEIKAHHLRLLYTS